MPSPPLSVVAGAAAEIGGALPFALRRPDPIPIHSFADVAIRSAIAELARALPHAMARTGPLMTI